MGDKQKAIDILFSAKRYDDAERLLQNVLSTGGADAWAYGKLARIYIKKGDAEKAVGFSKEAVKAEPESADPHRILAWSLHFRGDSIEAQREAETALQISPDDVESYNTLAWVLAKARRFHECIETCDQGLALDGKHAGLWNAKARALCDLGQWQDAIEVLHVAQQIECDKYFPHAALGSCFFHLQDYAKAEDYMKIALSINPHSQTAQELYREIQLRKRWFGRIWREFFPKHFPFLP